jgi:hypothetical protein
LLLLAKQQQQKSINLYTYDLSICYAWGALDILLDPFEQKMYDMTYNLKNIKTFSVLGPKSLRGNRFFIGHKDIAENGSQSVKKASIPLKMY